MNSHDQGTSPYSGNEIAAVDLGSNSFHMIVARITDDGSLQVIDSLKEMVRLGAGLDKRDNLSAKSQQRAFDCLERFGQRLRNIRSENLRIVGTNTLRKAKNSSEFLLNAQNLLGHSIEIISGIEEARLVYLGVSHSIADDDGNRLVIDIGGGSTETIIGEKFTPMMMESHHMGCVSISRLFFPDGKITKHRMKKADIFARRQLESISYPFLRKGWAQVIGSSGSIRSIQNVVQEEGFATSTITYKSMKALRKCLIDFGHIDSINLKGLSEDRKPVFIGGFVVLNALFKSLEIKEMTTSDGALREGLLYELLGRINHEDVREVTIQRMAERYSIQADHAKNIIATANHLYRDVAQKWNISELNYLSILGWASLLHEIGLTIAHSGYHKHGAYLTRNSDMPGFSLQEQELLSVLILSHRKNFSLQNFENLPSRIIDAAMKLAIILRLSVILHRNRTNTQIPELKIKPGKNSLKISFPDDWLDMHALTYADLKQEKELLNSAGFKLKLG